MLALHAHGVNTLHVEWNECLKHNNYSYRNWHIVHGHIWMSQRQRTAKHRYIRYIRSCMTATGTGKVVTLSMSGQCTNSCLAKSNGISSVTRNMGHGYVGRGMPNWYSQHSTMV